MPKFFLTNCGVTVSVSEQDADLVLNHTWCITTKGYLYNAKKRIYLHKEIKKRIGITGIVDHKDHDVYNNERDNLRPATNSQNIANSKRRRDNSSGYKGVSKYKWRSNCWLAKLVHEGKEFYLGIFETAEDAARAYDRKAVELFGEYAATNERLGLL